jgi:hypothetical protein
VTIDGLAARKGRHIASSLASSLKGWQLIGFVLAANLIGACSNNKKPAVDAAPVNADGGSKDAVKDNHPVDDAGSAERPTDPQSGCMSDAGVKSKGPGESCTCASECRSGFCTDGVCCDSACGETCKSCALPSSLGTCSLVPAGAPPSQRSQCPADRTSSCGLDGTCDGAGQCRKYVSGVLCKNGTCDGDSIVGALACDGKGSCSQKTTTNCYPYTCDTSTNECKPDCTSNADCAANQTCFANSCGRKLNGAKSERASDCLSGYLADGVCCNLACSAPCMSCNEPGYAGRCRLIGFGVEHLTKCPKEEQNTCGTTGACDGAGDCQIWGESTPCGNAECIGTTLLNTARVCDGLGTCSYPQLVDCAPFLCDGTQCNGSCVSDDQCEPGHACVETTVNGMSTGTCGKKQIGQPCTDASECQSEQCVDGVCCESSCEGACRSCGLPGSPGRCVSISAGRPDLHNQCKDAGKTACGTNGLCDGSGGCQKYATGTECGVQSCKDGAYTPAPTCNAAGQCVASPSRSCFPFVCNDSTCYTSCSSQLECSSGNYCVDSSCGTKDDGADCSTGKECKSGFCAQGVCCNSACTDECMSCNQPTTLGICASVPDGTPDPQEKCNVTVDTSCGTTGKCLAAKCAYWDKGTQCKPSVCASTSSVTPAGTCDGVGMCVVPDDKSCGTFLCRSNACPNSCQDDSWCLAPNTCVNGSCGRKPNGATCSSGSQCSSGNCTEGVCCDTPCSDAASGSLCKSCKVSGKVGTCSPVPAGKADPKQRCAASDAGKGDCSNDGTCDGKGACEPWSTNTGCRQASCSGGNFTPAAQCDGAGHCPAATTQACDPYVCSATSPSCLTTCTSNADCKSGLTCLTTNNTCGDKQANGKSCKANSDCTSGFCSPEGVCCNSACSGACQSCTLTGKVGTCSSIASGGTPRDTTTCAVNASNVCGNTGKCNGNNGCQLASVGTTCGNASCAPAISGTVGGASVQESVARLPAPTCDGAGACVPGSSISCGAFQCNASNAQCKTTCSSTSSDCYAIESTSGGNSCISGTCQKSPNGSTCSTGSTCASGNCVDGRCCGSASCGACLACNIANAQGNYDGVCRAVGAGVTEPHGLCSTTASSTCGTDGKCNGAGACEKWNGSTCTVASAACADTHHTVNTAGTCNGSGTCAPGTPVACGVGYLCLSATGACAASCTSGNEATNCDTADGFSCGSGGTCQKTGLGAACTTNNQCSTGYCVDGVCCQSSSCADCSSCNVAGSVGTCHAVAANTADGACTATCPTSTSTSGLCDGSGACKGASSCQTGYVCTAGACATTCTSNAQCDTAAGYACASGGTCKKAAGQSCSAAADCASGFCVQDICCSTGCTGGCQTCTATPGTCTSIAAGGTPRDSSCAANPPCGDTGVCDGAGACQIASSTTACSVPLTCTGATESGGTSTCDGHGQCNTPTPHPCTTGYVCSGNQCATTCTVGVGSECATGYTCASDGHCKKADAQTCGADGDCANGHCIDNGTGTKICCAVACTDATCGKKALCTTNGLDCQTHAGETCGTATCSADNLSRIPTGTCDGSGGCTPADPVACTTGYLCSGGTCAGNCSGDSSCNVSGGYACFGTSCKKTDGQPCSGATECGHNSCITNGTSNICCATACSDVACGTKAACAADGSGCQTHAGETCGVAGCGTDGISTVTVGTCNGSGACNQPSTPCTVGYKCLSGACETSCTANTSCATGYVCDMGSPGTCVLGPS